MGAPGTAGAVIDAEAAGVETVALGCGPTTTVAVAAGWLGPGTVAVTEALGVETAGVVTAGVVTAGVVTAGVVTVGVVAGGAVTAGVVTAGVVTAGVVTPPRAGPSASAAPASAPHDKNTNAAAGEALRRTTPLMSRSIPRSATVKQSALAVAAKLELTCESSSRGCVPCGPSRPPWPFLYLLKLDDGDSHPTGPAPGDRR